MKKTRTHIASYIIIYCCVTIVLLLILVPLYWMLISSFKSSSDALKSPIAWFRFDGTIANYVSLIRDMNVGGMAVNTLTITAFAILISTITCTMASYVFARFMTRAIRVPYLFLIYSALVPAVVAIRPLYDVFRRFHLINTFPGLIVLYTSSLIPFSIMVLTSFCKSIPIGIEEAARIDSANTAQIILLIAFPLLRPAIATICIVNFITCLNDFFTPLIFSEDIMTLSIGVISVPNLTGYLQPWELIATMGCIILLPIIIFVFVFERYIMEGLIAGSIKA